MGGSMNSPLLFALLSLLCLSSVYARSGSNENEVDKPLPVRNPLSKSVLNLNNENIKSYFSSADVSFDRIILEGQETGSYYSPSYSTSGNYPSPPVYNSPPSAPASPPSPIATGSVILTFRASFLGSYSELENSPVKMAYFRQSFVSITAAALNLSSSSVVISSIGSGEATRRLLQVTPDTVTVLFSVVLPPNTPAATATNLSTYVASNWAQFIQPFATANNLTVNGVINVTPSPPPPPPPPASSAVAPGSSTALLAFSLLGSVAAFHLLQHL